MASFLDVGGGTSKTEDEEIAKPLFGAGEVLGWIHFGQNLIAGHLPVKRGDEAFEALGTDSRIDLALFHLNIVAVRELS
jgi:hypothetical protein